jgi:hypothetical protein
MDKMFASVAGKLLTVLLAGTALSGPASAQEPRISAMARHQIETLMQEKALRTPAQRRISSDLLFETRRQRGEAIVQGLSSVRSSVRVDRTGRVLVDIKAEVTDDLLGRIESLGGRVVSAHTPYGAVRASVPLMQLEALAQLPQVRFIRTASLPVASKVDTSEGDVTHMADLARADLGVDGTGTKVCVLSDSVDSLAAVQASGDLPPTIEILPGQDGVALGAGEGVPETIGEGTAMLEVVHDLAPGASLGFATGWLDEASFAQNILDLRAAGCEVLVDNVIHATEPVFQDGIIAQAVDTVVADGAVYFSAAGNFGNLNDGTSGVWEGDFLATAVPIGSISSSYESAHDFGGGNALNPIDVDSPIGFTLQWSDPQGASTNDYDLFLIAANGSTVVDFSNNFQNSGTPGDPFEGIDSRGVDHTGMHLLIVRVAGAADRFVHLNAFGGQLAFATAGQTWGHSAAAGAFSVAAVTWGSGTPAPFTGAESVETYSSDGPRRVFYQPGGTPITPGDLSSTGGELRQKPDLAAADSVSTQTPGFETFFGTSASAAHAAAIAGLMLSKQPLLTAPDLRDIFAQTALDIEASGVDRDSGVGIVDALAAMRKLRDAVVSDFNADAMSDILWRHTDGRVVIWQMNGMIKEDALVIAKLATHWVIEDVGDFNEDARSDILWRSAVDSSVVIWEMDGFAKVSSAKIGTVDAIWTIAGIGDFNDDGHADILWHNGITGVAVVWLLDGYTKLATASIGSVDPSSWRVAGVGDFNGDDRSDILWHNTDTGQAIIWQMNGTTKQATASVGAPSTAWQVEAVGDFNADGRSDILWRNSISFDVVVWQMDGFVKEATAKIGAVSDAWIVARLGDYNGGGHHDVLWRNPSNGNTVIWQMNGFVKELTQSIGVVSTDWTIQ